MGGDCVTNANKSPKISYSAMVGKLENWSRVRIWDWRLTKSLSVLLINFWQTSAPLRAALARCSAAGPPWARGDGSPVSPGRGSPVPRGLLPPRVGRCRSSATSIFRPPPSCRAAARSAVGRSPSPVRQPAVRCLTASETRRSVPTVSGRSWGRVCFGMHLDT